MVSLGLFWKVICFGFILFCSNEKYDSIALSQQPLIFHNINNIVWVEILGYILHYRSYSFCAPVSQSFPNYICIKTCHERYFKKIS